MIRAIVNVSVGSARYCQHCCRLSHELLKQPIGATSLFWMNMLPPHSPSHDAVPYAFKVYAIAASRRMGYSSILWMDSSIVPLENLEPLWAEIEEKGYWFSENFPCARTDERYNCGQWTSDAALEPLGITREEAFNIPLVIATSFGLDFKHKIAGTFFDEWVRLAEGKQAFIGPWANTHGEASPDPRVLGHRHDQTAASVLAYRLGMKLTTPPKWIVDGIAPTDETILSIQRT